MIQSFKKNNYWALILGGSSGLRLASAQKLARHSMNICIVHRDSRSKQEVIAKAFAKIKEEGIQFLSFNVDATRLGHINLVIEQLVSKFAGKGKIRCFINSIARGNLKAMIDSQKSELERQDFRATIDYMALPLYQWTKALYRANVLANDTRVISFTS